MTFDSTSQDRRGQDQQMAKPVKPTRSAAPAAKPKRGRPLAKGATGLRGKCWWLMRELGTFTVNRLLETYATGEEKDAHNNLTHYLEQLEACGVVTRLSRRQPGEAQNSRGYLVWRLTRNLGPLAPVWRWREKVIWDPNRREVVAPLATAPKKQASSVNSETGFEND